VDELSGQDCARYLEDKNKNHGCGRQSLVRVRVSIKVTARISVKTKYRLVSPYT